MAGPKNSRSMTVAATDSTAAGSLVHAVVIVGLLNVMYYICREAYNIRLYAINEFGRIIHEFDPYFNYRATEVWMNGIWLRSVCMYGIHSGLSFFLWLTSSLSSLSIPLFYSSTCTRMGGRSSVPGSTTKCGIRWAVPWGRPSSPACK
jgi:hypothetical protein